MPASQVDVVHHESFDNFVGLKLEAKVIEVREGGKNVILSRRAMLIVAKERRKELLKTSRWATRLKGRCKACNRLEPSSTSEDSKGSFMLPNCLILV